MKQQRRAIGVHIDIDLWRRFRARAIEHEKMPAGRLLENVIVEYLRDAKNKNREDKK